jgi:hypothetical protein
MSLEKTIIKGNKIFLFFVLKNVCCVACVTANIHKEHADQVKSVVDVANEEKKILNEHLNKIKSLQSVFINEQSQLHQILEGKNKHLYI